MRCSLFQIIGIGAVVLMLAKSDVFSQSQTWPSFTYTHRNIFVRCLVTDAFGKNIDADFIIDTGLNRTTVDESFADRLGLRTVGTGRASAPSGHVTRVQKEIPAIEFAGVQKTNLRVDVEDLDRYRKGYEHAVDGFLGTDFFGALVLSIDVAHQKLKMQDKIAVETDNLLLDVQGTTFKGLLLVPITLPNGIRSSVIVDTGADSPSDFVFFEESLRDIPLDVDSTSTISDATGIVQRIYHGKIEFVKLGSLEIRHARVSRRPASTENPYETPYRPGLLTCQFFEGYRVDIDFPKSTLRLYKK